MIKQPDVTLSDVFEPLIGLCAWQVRNEWGTMVTMEFGDPHLNIREPIVASPDSSEKVRHNLARRRITVIGFWHLWIEQAHWEIKTQHKMASSQTSTRSEIQEVLTDLDGQKFVSLQPLVPNGKFRLAFDLGGTVEIWPAADIDADQWSLRKKGGSYLIGGPDGGMSYGKNT